MSEIKNKTISGVKWSAIERIALQGIQFLIGIVLARLLSPSDFGIVGMITIFLALSQSLIDSGFSNALIRKIDRTQTDCSTVFFFNIILGLIMVGILCLCSPLIADFFGKPELNDITKVVSLTLFFNSLAVVQTALLTSDVNFKTQAKATLIATLLSGAIGIICAYIGLGVWSLVWQSVSSSIFRTILLWVLSKWRPTLEFSWFSFRSLFSYGSKLMLSGIIGTLCIQLSTIMIGKFYTPADLGYYSRGSHFAHLPSQTFTGILQRVTFPILAKKQNDEDGMISLYRKYIKVTSMCIFFFLLLLAALAKPIILVLLTERWAPSVIYLQIFCLAYLTTHIAQINLNLLQVKGRSDLYLRLEIIKRILSLGLMLAAVPFGVIAICLSVFIYSQFALIVNTYYTGKLFRLGYWSQIKDFSPYLIKTLISVLPAYMLTYLPLNNWLTIIVGIILSMTIYSILLYLSHDVFFEDIVINTLLKFKNNKK